ncbi:MAG: acyltransferase family protein [Rivularia sp. ALOHA_DT_140]|nr:acyltransferase family protein [Rivularia sp. ALOHA_DT_140]
MVRKINWIDCWKGIAIGLVVLGHILDSDVSRYIFWFHIPLFLFISGYTYKEEYDYLYFLKKKFLRLIIPYISFLILFILPSLTTYIHEIWVTKQLESIYKLILFTFKQFYGGEALADNFALFWLITCLFFTQQLYNFIYTKLGSDKWLINIIMLDAYCLAIIDYLLFQDVHFPWNINVVLMALPFYWLGHMASQNFNILNSIKLAQIALFTISITFLLDKFSFIEFTFDMGHKMYGIPIINFLTAIAGIIIVCQIAKIIDKTKLFHSVIREISAASMIIIYLHQPIQIALKNISFLNESIVRLIAALLIPYLIYKVIINFSLTRRFLLGDFKSKTNLKFKSLSNAKM